MIYDDIYISRNKVIAVFKKLGLPCSFINNSTDNYYTVDFLFSELCRVSDDIYRVFSVVSSILGSCDNIKSRFKLVRKIFFSDKFISCYVNGDDMDTMYMFDDSGCYLKNVHSKSKLVNVA